MTLKLLSLYICILCLVSGFALGNSIQSKSPSFPNQFIERCNTHFSQAQTEDSNFHETSILEGKEFQENEKESTLASEETQNGFFGSIWSYAQQGLDSAKQKLKKVPNALSRQASAIGYKAKNLPNVLSKEVSKAGKTIDHLGRKVSGGISDLISKPSQTNVTEPIPKQVRDNETLTNNPIVASEKSKDEIQAEQIRLLQKKVKETSSGLESTFSSVKSIPRYVSNTLQAISNKAKKSTKDLSNGASVLGKKLKQMPQNITRALQGTAQFWKNAVSNGFSKLGSKIQSVPATISNVGHNLTRAFNQTRMTQTKNLWTQKIKSIPERLGKALSQIGNQFKKIIPANVSFSEGINKIKQRVNATSVSKAINTFTTKLTNIPSKVKKTISLTFQGVKQKISAPIASAIKFIKEKSVNLPSFSEGAEYMVNSFGRFTSSIGSCFSSAKNFIQGFLFGTFRLIMRLWGFISSLKTILYWILGAILSVVFLYFMAQALPIINFIIKIVRTPLDVFSLIMAITKSILPKKNQNLSKEEKEILEKFRKNKTSKSSKPAKQGLKEEEKTIPSQKNKEHQYYSYYRCDACDKEWESPNTAENETQKCINDDCVKIIEPYHQIKLLSGKDKPTRKVFFSYYNCPSCEEKWESPKTLENEAQECKNSKCSKEVLPYHQIQLLNSEQKLDKEKIHSKK